MRTKCSGPKDTIAVQELPAHPRRILLINPTRFLGNLLIAGGLAQDFAEYCVGHGIEFRLVVDESFAALLAAAFRPEQLILYPRSRIHQASLLHQVQLYWQCLREIRRFRADLAFNIEDDSVAHRLTQLSSAAFRLGCSPARHRHGYEQVLPVQIMERPIGQQHRWHSYREVFATLGLSAFLKAQPHYLKLHAPPLSEEVLTRLRERGVDFSRRLALLHTGATKAYKLWPPAHFAQLALLLMARNYQVVLLGAGKDVQDIEATLALLPEFERGKVVNLCNQLSLVELASFMTGYASLMVGNDSGPSHLAAALGIKGVVIFGPTEAAVWGPIAPNSVLLQDRSVCAVECTRHHCLRGYQCLSTLMPKQVMKSLQL
jgi:ADP-heptose:LPS heptosyltransferase